MNVSDFMSTKVISLPPEACLDQAMDLMDSAAIRHLPVLQNGHLIGILSERDLLEATGWLPKRVRDLLEAPEGQIKDFMQAPVVTLSTMDSVVTAALRLLEWKIGCLPVLRDAELVGMLSETDIFELYARACQASPISVDSDPHVEQVMTTDFVSAAPEMQAEEALEYCRAKKIRHLPILEAEALLGILSDRDLRCSLGRGQIEGTKVIELCSDRLITLAPDARLSEAAQLLVDEGIGAVPITQEGRLLGLVSSSDVLLHCSVAFAAVLETPGA